MAPLLCNCALSQSKDLLQDKIDDLQYVLQKVKLCLKSKENLVEMQAEQLKKMEQMHKNVLDENEKLNYQNRRLSNDYENMKIILKGHETRPKKSNMNNKDSQTIQDITENETQTDIMPSVELEEDCCNCKIYARTIEILEKENANFLTQIESQNKTPSVLIESQCMTDKSFETLQSDQNLENELENYKKQIELLEQENNELIMRNEELQNVHILEAQQSYCCAKTINENRFEESISEIKNILVDLSKKLNGTREGINNYDDFDNSTIRKMSKELIENIDVLQRELSEKTAKICDLECSLKLLEDMQLNNNSNLEKLDKLKDQIERLEQEKLDNAASEMALSDEVTKLKDQLDNYQKELQEKAETIETIEQVKRDLQNQVDNLLQAMSADAATQMEKHESEQSCQSKLSEQNYEKEIENLKKQIDLLEQENELLKTCNKKLKEAQPQETETKPQDCCCQKTIFELKTMLAELNKKVSGTDHEKLQIQSNGNCKELKKLKDSLRRLQKELLEAKASEITSEKEVRKLKSLTSALQRELAEKNMKIQSLEKEKNSNNRLKKALEPKVEKEFNSLREYVEKLEKDLTEKNSKIKSLEEIRKDCEIKMKNNESQIKVKDQEIMRLKEEIISYQKKIKEMDCCILANNSSKMDRNLERNLRENNEELRAKVKCLEKCVADYECELECLRKESCQSGKSTDFEQLKQLRNERVNLKFKMGKAEEDLQVCRQELELCKCQSSKLAQEFKLLKKERLQEAKSVDDKILQDVIVKACCLKCCCFKLLNRYRLESCKMQELHQFHDILLSSYKKLEDQNRYYRTENSALRTAVNNFACTSNCSLNAQVEKLRHEFNEMKQAVAVPNRQERETSVEVENHTICKDKTLETDFKNKQGNPDKTVIISEWKNKNFTERSKSSTDETSVNPEGGNNNERQVVEELQPPDLQNSSTSDALRVQDKYSFSIDVLEKLLDTLERRELDVKALTEQLKTYKANDGQVSQLKENEASSDTCQCEVETTVGIDEKRLTEQLKTYKANDGQVSQLKEHEASSDTCQCEMETTVGINEKRSLNDKSVENRLECNKIGVAIENKDDGFDEKLQDEISNLQNIIKKYHNEVDLMTKHRDALLNLQTDCECGNDGGKINHSELLLNIFQESNVITKLNHELALRQEELEKKSHKSTVDTLKMKDKIIPKTNLTHMEILDKKEKEVEKLKHKLRTCECFQEKYITDKHNLIQILLLRLRSHQKESGTVKDKINSNAYYENVCISKQFYDCQEELEIAKQLTAELIAFKNEQDLQSSAAADTTRDNNLLKSFYEKEEEIGQMKCKLDIWKHHHRRLILVKNCVMESVQNEIMKYKNRLKLLTIECDSLAALEEQCKSGDMPFKEFDRSKLEENILNKNKKLAQTVNILESYELYLETTKQQRDSLEALYKDASLLFAEDFVKFELGTEPLCYRSDNGKVNNNETVQNNKPCQKCENKDFVTSLCTAPANTAPASCYSNEDLLQVISINSKCDEPFKEDRCNCRECEDLRNAIKNHVEKVSALYSKATGQRVSDKESTCSTTGKLEQVENYFNHLLSMAQKLDEAQLGATSKLESNNLNEEEISTKERVCCRALKEQIAVLRNDINLKDNELLKLQQEVAEANVISLELAELKNVSVNLIGTITELIGQISEQKAVKFDANDDICSKLRNVEQQLRHCFKCVLLEKKQMFEALDEQKELADKFEKLLLELDVKNNDIEDLRTQIATASQEAHHFLELEGASVKHIKSLLKLVNEVAGADTERFNMAEGIVPLFEDTEKLLKECFNNLHAEKHVEIEKYEQKIRNLEGKKCQCYNSEENKDLGNISTAQSNTNVEVSNDTIATNEKVDDNILNKLSNLETASRNHVKKLAEFVLRIKDIEMIDTEGDIPSLFVTTENLLAQCIDEIVKRKESANTQTETSTTNMLETPAHDVHLEDNDKEFLEEIFRLKNSVSKLESQILQLKNEYAKQTASNSFSGKDIEDLKAEYEQLICEERKQWEQIFERCNVENEKVINLVDGTVQCKLEPEQFKDEQEWKRELENKNFEIEALKTEVDRCNEIICSQSLFEYFTDKYTDEEGFRELGVKKRNQPKEKCQENILDSAKLDNNERRCCFVDKSNSLEALKTGLQEFYESGWKQLEKCKLDKIENEKGKNHDIEILKKKIEELEGKNNRNSLLKFEIDRLYDILQYKLTKEEFEGKFSLDNVCLVTCSEKELNCLRDKLLNLYETVLNERERFKKKFSIDMDKELERLKYKLQEIKDLREKEQEKWNREVQECKVLYRDSHNSKNADIAALKAEINNLQKEINELNAELNLQTNQAGLKSKNTAHSSNSKILKKRSSQDRRGVDKIIEKLKIELVNKDEQLNSQKNELMALQSLKRDLEQAKELWNRCKSVLQTKDEELQFLRQELQVLKSNKLNCDEKYKSIIELTDSMRKNCNFILHEYDSLVQELKEQQQINGILVKHYACLLQHYDSLKHESNHFKNRTQQVISNLQNKLREVLSLLSTNKCPACVKTENVEGATTNKTETGNLPPQEYITNLEDFISNIENQTEVVTKQKATELPSTTTSSSRSNVLRANSSEESTSGSNYLQSHIETLLNNLNQQNKEYNDGIQNLESNANKIKEKLKHLDEMTQKLKEQFDHSQQQ